MLVKLLNAKFWSGTQRIEQRLLNYSLLNKISFALRPALATDAHRPSERANTPLETVSRNRSQHALGFLLLEVWGQPLEVTAGRPGAPVPTPVPLNNTILHLNTLLK